MAGNMEASSSVYPTVLQLQQEVIENVNLMQLIPAMNAKKLLTSHENNHLSNDYHTRERRCMDLTTYIANKGDDGLAGFYCCLRSTAETHRRHQLLADRMLQIWPRLSQLQDPLPASSSNVVPYSQIASQFPVSSFPQSSTLSSTHHSTQEGQIQHAYNCLIGTVCRCLSDRRINAESFIGAVNRSLYPLANSLTVNFPHSSELQEIFQFLEEHKICHALDVDLLLHVLKESLQQEDLYEEVLAYWRRIEHLSINCQECRFMQATLISTDFLFMMTHHPSLTITVQDVRRMKQFYADNFSLPRHLFWFCGSQTGSLVLVWKLSETYSDKLQCFLENKCNFESFQHCISLVCVKKGSTTIGEINLSDACSNSSVPSLGSDESEVSSTTSSNVNYFSSVHTGGKRRQSDDGDQYQAVDSKAPRVDSSWEGQSSGLEEGPSCDPSPQLGECRCIGTHDAGSLQATTISIPDWREWLLQHQTDVTELANLSVLVPVMNKHCLLTYQENAYLTGANTTPQERCQKLVEFLLQKGEDGYQRFLQSLQEERQHIGHVQLYRRLLSPPTPPPHPPQSATFSQKRSAEDSLKENLKGYYLGQNCHKTLVAGPCVDPMTFIRLALINKAKATPSKVELDRFLQQSLRGHVDDILRTKSKLELEDILKYKASKKAGKKVLVEGAAGIGKTMLAIRLCQLWAEEKCFQEYDLVLLVPLRRFSVEDSKSLTVRSMMEMYPGGQQCAEKLEKTGGAKVLIILEGWDELPPELRNQFTLFNDIISGLQLPKASLIVTSRPTLASELYSLVDRRVEVLGFGEEQVESYIRQRFPGTDEGLPRASASKVLEFLNKHPHIKALAHIPLTLTIICCVFSDADTVPETLTELYGECLYQTLRENLLKTSPSYKHQRIKSMAKEEVFSHAESIILPLCKLALSGFRESRFVFKAEDLRSVGLDPQGRFDGLGLLTPIPSFRHPIAEHNQSPDCELLYQFRHLTVQEFLAAKQIPQLSEEEQGEVLRAHRKDKQFYNTWKFLAGTTHLQNETFRDSLNSSVNEKDSKDLLFFLHCLYEAHSESICASVAANKLNYKLDFSNNSLNATDCLCAAYIVATAGGDWTLIFRGSHIGAEGLKTLKQHLEETYAERNRDAQDYHLRIASLDLALNNLKNEAVDQLGKFLNGSIVIEKLDVTANHSLGDKGTAALAAHLEDNKCLTSLHFSGCGLTSEGAACLGKMLEKNRHLTSLSVPFEKIGDEGVTHLACALEVNNTLTELNIGDVGMTSSGVRRLSFHLSNNKGLENLRLDHNGFGPSDCPHIARLIKEATRLVLLELSKNPIEDEGFITVLDAIEDSHECALKRLGVYGCEIKVRGMERLCSFLKRNTSIEGIQLGCNPLHDEGAKHLIEGVKNNQSLTKLWLEGVAVSNSMKAELQQLNHHRAGLLVIFEHHAKFWKKEGKKL